LLRRAVMVWLRDIQTLLLVLLWMSLAWARVSAVDQPMSFEFLHDWLVSSLPTPLLYLFLWPVGLAHMILCIVLAARVAWCLSDHEFEASSCVIGPWYCSCFGGMCSRLDLYLHLHPFPAGLEPCSAGNEWTSIKEGWQLRYRTSVSKFAR
jgi:hypothetical protein